MIAKSLAETWPAVAPVLANHLWQSTLFALAAALLALTLRKNHARARYGLWLAASAKFLIPFSLLVGLGTLVPHRAGARVVGTKWMTAAQEFSQPFTFPTAAAPFVHPAGAAEFGYLRAAAWALWACGFAAVSISWALRWRRIHAIRRSARLLDVSTALVMPVPVMAAEIRLVTR